MVDEVREIVMKHWYEGAGRGAKPHKEAVFATMRANGADARVEHLINTDANIGRIVMDASNLIRKLAKNGDAIKIVDVAGKVFEYAVEVGANTEPVAAE